ncbi:DUF6292 family protein [Amycolatopsis eburnea]|uniref:DUF6292 domain-containing protein n=1 Tax=Amycolatopsis eburnea TaxID=2267691 RepID=A0A3R9DU68_9PSEU|nr:DUF6292 family protein [Amycolatopsis eburnea]RSD13586.1 hypothetical protein EIY87_28170 [Amycolatopsis eburnea]
MLDHDASREAFGLAGYVRAVAAAVAVPWSDAAWEVGDHPAAYLALPARCVDHPGRDLILIWSSRRGWKLCMESTLHDPPAVVARLGTQVVPAPAEVESFVGEVLAGRRKGGRSAPSLPKEGPGLTELLSGYAVGREAPRL